MELKKEYVEEKEEKKNQAEIKNLKLLISNQQQEINILTNNIKELTENLTIMVRIFKKYDEEFTEKIRNFQEKADKLELGAAEIKIGIKAGVKESVENETEKTLKIILNNFNERLNKISTDTEKIVEKEQRSIKRANIFNNISRIIMVFVIVLTGFMYYEFRSLREETDEKLAKIENIQEIFGNLALEKTKFWYSEKDKKKYLDRVEDIRKEKNKKIK